VAEAQNFARGLDRLPPEVLPAYEQVLMRSLATEELHGAFRVAVDLFLAEVREVRPELAARLSGPLDEAAGSSGSS
jgi:hypothetical protein